MEMIPTAKEIAKYINSWIIMEKGQVTIFSGIGKGTIEYFIDNLLGLLSYVKTESILILFVLIYIKRLRRIFDVTIHNIRRLLLACTLIAIKYHDDDGIFTDQYAKYIGLKTKDVFNLEYNLLKLLDYDLCVDSDNIDSIKSDIFEANVEILNINVFDNSFE